jgi:hypothetical protein
MGTWGAARQRPELSSRETRNSRRGFLVSAALSTLGGAGGALLPSSLAAAASRQAIVDVTSHGAVGDGITVDTPAIQSAVDTAQAQGGIVLFPPGHYRVRNPGIRITRQVQLQGVGWETPLARAAPESLNGSWLYCDDPTTAVISLQGESATAAPRGASVRDLAIRHLQPLGATQPFTPVSYPFAITVGSGSTDVLLDNLFLLNPTQGIQVGNEPGGSVGRVLVRRVWGQPLTRGIVMDNCYDVVRIEHVHFWPFWAWAPASAPVASWQLANATAITLFRCDNPILSEVFCFGYKVGFSIAQGVTGTTHKCKLSQADFDICGIGILISHVTANGGDPHTFVNVSLQGPDTSSGDNPGGIVVEASTAVKLALTNVAIANYGGSGIYVSGPGSTLFVDNLFVRNVNRADNGSAGIKAGGGARARVGFQREIVVANAGPVTLGDVQLDDPLADALVGPTLLGVPKVRVPPIVRSAPGA